MSKLRFEDYFEDSTEFTFYGIKITSENGEEIFFDGVSDYSAREVYKLLKPQAAKDEPEKI